MKIIARILLILAAAGAVAAISVAVVGSQPARADGPRRGLPAQVQPGSALPGMPSAEQPRGGPGDVERGGGRSPSLFGAGEMLKDVAIIALIVAIVAPIARLLGRRSGAGKRPLPGSAAEDWGTDIAP